ncbi:unnamed protein product [Diamesa serratosioi]
MENFNTPLKPAKKRRMADVTPMKIPSSPFLEKLGYGTGVQVFLMNRNSKKSVNQSPWAIKKVNKNKTDDQIYASRLESEAGILKSLNNPYVVGFRSYTQAPDGRFNLAMEKCDASLGDLLEIRLENDSGPLELKNIRKMGLDISKALNYLHNVALILHGDIKSFNVLIKNDFEICKLCDFGVSVTILKNGLIDFKTKPTATYVGTDLWSAPEVFEEDATLISTKSEIFSFGLVLFETLALSPPHVLEEEDVKKTLNFDETEDSDAESEDPLSNLVGTRPVFPSDIDLSASYDETLQIFYICTKELPEDRPSAVILESIFEQMKVD